MKRDILGFQILAITLYYLGLQPNEHLFLYMGMVVSFK